MTISRLNPQDTVSDTWGDWEVGLVSSDTSFTLDAPRAIRLVGAGTTVATLDLMGR